MVQPNIVTGAFSNTIEEFGSVIFLCFFFPRFPSLQDGDTYTVEGCYPASCTSPSEEAEEGYVVYLGMVLPEE